MPGGLDPGLIPPYLMDERQWARWAREQTIIPDTGSVVESSIEDNSVTNAKLRDSAALSVVGRSSGTDGDPGDIESTADNQYLVRRSGALTWGAVLDSDFFQNVTVTSTTYTAGDLRIILVDDDSAGAEVTVTLPAAASSDNVTYLIKKLGSTANVVVNGNASETIDGAVTATLTVQYEAITIHCNGSAWYIL